MADLSTYYMGIALKNPLVVASSGLVNSVEGIKRAAAAGAGAIVVKSLFEEQIQAESHELETAMMESSHTEALEYIRAEVGMRFGVSDYLELIQQAKKEIDVPLIASMNCISPRWWLSYASQIAGSGVDALELNLSRMPVNPNSNAAQIEETFLSIVEDVKNEIDIPIAVKIGPYFTSLANFATELASRGASALVFFNRFYRPDIDIENFQAKAARPFSVPSEIHLSLRWIALLSGRLGIDLAASTGVHDAEGMIKQLLAGATVVQACSTFYENGFSKIEQMIEELQSWMERHDFNSLDEVRIRMQPELSDKPEVRERLQYIKIFGGVE